MTILEELFCPVDDFCQAFEPWWRKHLLQDGLLHRNRTRCLCLSEIMTILIAFHQSSYRNFKAFYLEKVCAHWNSAFPKLVSYQRFVEWMPNILLPLYAYLRHRFGPCTGISFMDSTSLKVCHNRRIYQHKVFKGLAQRGKTSVDWFFGFKLHVVVNDQGELLNVALTAGNVDDRVPVAQLLQGMMGKVFADKGYISKALSAHLRENSNIQLITKRRRNMKNQLIPPVDKFLLGKRSIVESIIDQFKNISQIEHSRHRSPVNFCVNLVCGLIAYCHQPKKPSLALHNALPSAA
jgi:transposase